MGTAAARIGKDKKAAERAFFAEKKRQQEAEAAAQALQREQQLSAMSGEDRAEALRKQAEAAAHERSQAKHLKTLAKAQGKGKNPLKKGKKKRRWKK